MELFLQEHSGALLILVLSALMFGTLLILVPQLLRAHQRTHEWRHTENMAALEKGLPVEPLDIRSLFAGRIALLVPMVSICSAATVTCFLVAYKSELIFAASLAVWCVAGVVSLAAITGGVALIGRLAHLNAGVDEEATEEEPAENHG